MHRVMSSALLVLLVLLFAPSAANLYAQDVSFQPAVDYPAGFGPWSVPVGDLNGDGVPDLAVANLGDCRDIPCVGSSVSVLLGNSDGTFQAAVSFDAGGGARSVAVGDFNGEGLPDLAVAHSIPSDLSVLINNTPRHAPVQATVDQGAQVILKGHFSFERPPTIPTALGKMATVLVSQPVAISGPREEDDEMTSIERECKSNSSAHHRQQVRSYVAQMAATLGTLFARETCHEEHP